MESVGNLCSPCPYMSSQYGEFIIVTLQEYFTSALRL